MNSPARVHLIGRKNSGKTTLMVELVTELTALGYAVGTIKHTHHQHELDTPGKDSHRHRMAGAVAVGILAPNMRAVFWPAQRESTSAAYDLLQPSFAECDLILVEGDIATDRPKFEVWRTETGQTPICAEGVVVAAVITDEAWPAAGTAAGNSLGSTRVLPRSDRSAIVAAVLAAAGLPN